MQISMSSSKNVPADAEGEATQETLPPLPLLSYRTETGPPSRRATSRAPLRPSWEAWAVVPASRQQPEKLKHDTGN